MSQILTLAQELIRIPSTKEDPAARHTVLERATAELSGFASQTFTSKEVESRFFYSTATKPKRCKVILNAHLDVVPAADSQYEPVIKGDQLWGRGANDMKAAAAVEILVFKEIASKVSYPLGLQLVTDEETGGFNGTKYQLEQGVTADFVVAGEGTDFGVNTEAKGIVWANIKVVGAAAHGAYPWQGDNALWKLQIILARLHKAFPTPQKEVWRTTVNLAKIETGNQTYNKVPGEAEARLDIRYIPADSNTIIPALEKIVGTDGTLEIVTKEPAQQANQKDIIYKKLREAVKEETGHIAPLIVKHGGSDIRHYTGAGSNGVTFGPIGAGLHTDNEWVSITSLEAYYRILKSWLLSLE